MKWIAGLFLLLICGMPYLAADDFEDLIHACARASENYNRAIRSDNTRYEQEYQANLNELRRLGRDVQQVIRRLNLGQDFNFPQLINELDSIYADRAGKNVRRDAPRFRSGNPHSESPQGIFEVLTFDVKALRNMDFTTDDGGSVKSSIETRRRLFEYERLYAFFRKYNRKVMKHPQKEASLKKVFDSRCRRMKQLAVELAEFARQRNPGSQSRYSLPQETGRMLDCFSRLAEQENEDRRNPRRYKKKKRMDGQNSSDELYSEMNLCMRNINELLILWKQSGFLTDPPVRKKGLPETDPAAPLKRESPGQKDYTAMNAQQLTALLNRRRQKIFRGNSSLDGFDRDSERMYMLSLSSGEKQLYRKYLQEYKDSGYQSGPAVRSAILKLHTYLQTQEKMLPVKELIHLHEALDREELRRKEKTDVQFKLKSGNVK